MRPYAASARLCADRPAEPDESLSLPFADVPQNWKSIVIGSLVLAASGDDSGGWYEAVVIETKADDLLVLRWRNWPDHDPFLRPPGALALLPAPTVEPE